MTRTPDRPETADRFVVDTIMVNPLKTRPYGTTHRLSAVGPLLAAPLQMLADRGKPRQDPSRSWAPATLALWPHPTPRAVRRTPVVTDLIRALEPPRWRFEVEHVTAGIAEFFTDQDAQGYQLQLWLDRQHLPEHIAEQDQNSAGKPPVWPRVMFFHVLPPDRLPGDGDGGTETISGVVENLPGRTESSAHISLSGLELCTRLGNILFRDRQPAVAGLYRTFDEVIYEQPDV